MKLECYSICPLEGTRHHSLDSPSSAPARMPSAAGSTQHSFLPGSEVAPGPAEGTVVVLCLLNRPPVVRVGCIGPRKRISKLQCSNPKLRHPSLAAVGTKSCWLLKPALHTFLCGCLDLSEPVFPLVCNVNISTCIGLYSRRKNLYAPPPYCLLGLQRSLRKPFRHLYIPTLMGKLARPWPPDLS